MQMRAALILSLTSDTQTSPTQNRFEEPTEEQIDFINIESPQLPNMCEKKLSVNLCLSVIPLPSRYPAVSVARYISQVK